MATIQRTEIWSDYQCASGSRQAIVPLNHWHTLDATRRITGDDELVGELSDSAPSYTSFALGSVLRILFSDGSFDEWKIHQLDDGSGKKLRSLKVSCRSVLYELRDRAVMYTTTGTQVSGVKRYDAQTPVAVVDDVITFLPGWWARGTVDPTATVSFEATFPTPMETLRAMLSALKASGVTAELTARRNGTTGYYVDVVTAIGSSATSPDIRTGKNLLSLSRTRTRETYVTRVYPVSDNGTSIGAAYFYVASISGSDIEIRVPESGANPIGEDDQYNNLYLENDAGTRTQISDTVQSTAKVTVASTAGFATNELCRVVQDSSGTATAYLDKVGVSTHRVGVLSLSGLGTANLCRNPAMSVWTGAASSAPDNWTTSGGPSLLRTTTAGLWLTAGKSCKHTGGSYLLSPTQNFYVPTTSTQAVFSVWVYVDTYVSVDPTIDWQISGVTVSTTTLTASSYVTDTWHRVDYIADLTSYAGASRTMNVRLNSGNATVYWDSVQITLGASALAFYNGNGPADLWVRANTHLSSYGTTPTTYVFDAADLHQWDGTAFPYEALTLGATTNVRDTDIGLTISARIVEMTQRYRDPINTGIVVLSTVPTQFTRIMESELASVRAA